jgi:acyl transferase domain-containing protein/phosphopantetheinyl transferase (holo-ACP synthase)
VSHAGTSAPESGAAIIGMACLFPGAPSLDAYWHNILGKVDATSDPPPEAWDPDVYYDPEFNDTDRTYCQRGGYLGALAEFDPLAHGIPPVAVGGEPDQWLALQVARDALADAGATELPDEIRARTATILGKGTYLNGGNAVAVQRGLVIGQTLELLRQLHPEYSPERLEQLRGELQSLLPPLGPETVPGLIPNIIVGRIANRLDLMGPAYTVDAACASSLVAVQHALRDLDAGHCDLALAGGAQVWMPVATMNLFCRLGALSRRQQLRAFDKNADGTLLGEGIGIVVLKRVADAVRDGDRVYAVIKGVGVASDGRGVSVMAPRVDGEELALRRAYEDAAVSPSSVSLIEAHGTGTPVGDVVEIQALTRVFGERRGGLPPTAIGTVKSMISHTIPAAGVAGLIKTALALYDRVLPPTLNVDEPNPALGLERTPFYINTETRPWIHGGAEPRRAGINAFGFGGINAHAVLEEFDGATSGDHRAPWDSEVCILEAGSRATLIAQARELVQTLEARPEVSLTNLAFTLGQSLGGIEQPQRLAIVATSCGGLREKLEQAIPKLQDENCRRIKTMSGIYYEGDPLGRDGKVVLVFPGEGAQYPHMLADLCLHFPEARAVFDRIDRLYADHPRGHLLSDWVYPRPSFSDAERLQTEQRLMDLDMAVESVLTANGAMYAVVSRLLGRVDAMLGHSTGEHSAAMAAGALDVDTDERLARFCHGLHASYDDAASRHEVPGAVLLAVGGDADNVRRIAAEAGGELHLAMDNCPHQAVLVGEARAIEQARGIAVGEGLMCEQLPYDRAVHTPLFAPFAEDLREIFAQLPVRASNVELWSCTTADRYPDDPAQIRELLVEHWTSPVRFREAIERLHDNGARVFIETGPRGNMTSFIDDILRGRRNLAVATDNRRRSGLAQLNHVTAMLAVHDVPIDPGYLFAQRRAEAIEWGQAVQATTPAPSARIPLWTSWPMLKLGPDAVERLRSQPNPPAPSANGHAPASESRPAPAAHAPPVAQAVSVAQAPPQRETETAPSVAAQEDASDEVSVAVEEHLETMARFLETGEQVMRAYLDGGAPLLVEHARRPLVGTIVSWSPESELIAQRVVDPAEDRYLLDHTLGRGVSRTDPELHALALMPLAMSIEIMAEAASCLLPGLVVTGLRDVHAYRWLAFGDAPKTLELSARRLDGDGILERVAVQLRCLDDDDAPAGPFAEATVLLGSSYPTPPAPSSQEFQGGRPSGVVPDQLYRETMFHGPLWQGVRKLELVAPGGAVAQLQVPPRLGLLRGSPEPEFVLDPVVLDAAGQVIGFWAAEQFERARVVFPFRLAALDLYGSRRPAGELMRCTAAIGLHGEQFTHSNIEVLDADGHCTMRLTGWDDKRFDVPDRLRALTLPGELGALSRRWDEPDGETHDAPVACRRADATIPSDGGLWKQVWASRVLSRNERRRFDELRLPEPRQLEWLAGRTAAKEAVAELLRTHHGLDLLPADIEIMPDARGVPMVSAPGCAEAGVEPVVSLTHAGGHAAAFAALLGAGAAGEVGIGIDLEPLQERPPGFAEAALTAAELEVLRGLPGGADAEWLLRCWCAKEAAGKALGSGLAPGGDAPTVEAVDPDHQQVVVQVGPTRMSVDTRRDGDLIVARTLYAPIKAAA